MGRSYTSIARTHGGAPMGATASLRTPQERPMGAMPLTPRHPSAPRRSAPWARCLWRDNSRAINQYLLNPVSTSSAQALMPPATL